MDPVPDAIKVQDRELPVGQLASCWCQVALSGRQEWQRRQSRLRQVHGPQPTKLPLPAQNLPTYFLITVNFFYLDRTNPISPKDSSPPTRLLRTRRASLRHAVKSIELSCSSTNINSESHSS